MQAQLSLPAFNDDRLPPRFWQKVRVGDAPAQRPELGPCWEWTAANNGQGYGRFRIGSHTHRNRMMVLAHRLAYERLIGPIPEGLETDHLCRNHSCVNPFHLEPVLHTVNVQRSPFLGRNGEGSAKLTAKDIPIIRALRANVSQRRLAALYGVDHGTIGRIQRGQRWRHVSSGSAVAIKERAPSG